MRILSVLAIGIFGGAVGCIPPAPNEASATAKGKGDSPMQTAAPATCGSQTFPLAAASVPPNVYLVVDRSGSMSDPFDSNQSGTKWDAAQTALGTLLTNSAGKAQWGLSLFPPNPQHDTCGKATIDVPLQLGTEAAILSRINSLTNDLIAHPRGSTPTADALATVRDAANLAASDRGNFVVLVTDGLPSCNNASDVTAVIDQMYARSPSVRTFVIGVGGETASNPDLLNQWAERGHTPRPDPMHKYYQANDAGQLVDAFGTIIDQTQSCTFKVDPPPADASLVAGQLDGVSLTKDPTNGFTYDASTQSGIFHGIACDKITQHTAMKVGVVFGCPPPVIQ